MMKSLLVPRGHIVTKIIPSYIYTNQSQKGDVNQLEAMFDIQLAS